MPLLVKKLREDAILPVYQHEDDAGFDLACPERLLVPAMACLKAPTGLAFAIPPGYEMQLRLRSGIAANTPIIMPNSPATIDAGYRGELFILLRNLAGRDWEFLKGERIVQGIIAPIIRAVIKETESLPASDRGTGAFGSSGRF